MMDFMQMMGQMPHAQWAAYMLPDSQPIAPTTPRAKDRRRSTSRKL